MKKFDYVITDPVGLHARPAGLFVKEVTQYQSVVTLYKGEKSADGKKIIALMALGVNKGDCVTITVDGPDEEEAAEQIEAFMKENL